MCKCLISLVNLSIMPISEITQFFLSFNMKIEPFLKKSQPNYNTIDGFISRTKLNNFRNVPKNRSKCKPSREEISPNRNTRFVVFVKVVIVAVALADLGARNGLVPVQ